MTTVRVVSDPYPTVGEKTPVARIHYRHPNGQIGRPPLREDQVLPWIRAHVLARIQQTEAGCWEWTGYRTSRGYGRTKVLTNRSQEAHRVAYEALVGPIPEGMHLDHLCRNPPCVNPEHLEPVSPQENLDRGVHPTAIVRRTGKCQRGHEFAGDNLYPQADGRVTCRACRKASRDRWNQKVSEQRRARREVAS